MFKLTFLFILCFIFSFAQDKKNELALINSHTVGEPQAESKLNTKTPLETKRHNAIAKYNPVSLTFTGLMLFYQHIVSAQLNATCVYTRSCSNFAKEAIKEYGIVKGVFLAADRLMRCNPQCENDIPAYSFDPNGKAEDEPSLYQFK